MEKEKKAVFLTILTLIMYGIVNVMLGGPFAFFPINEIVFFLLVVFFAVRNFNRAPFSYIFFLLASLFDLVSNQFFSEILIGHQKLIFFLDTRDRYLFNLIAYFFLLAEMFHSFKRMDVKKNWIAFPFITGTFLLYAGFQKLTFAVSGMALYLLCLLLFYKKQENAEKICNYKVTSYK